MTDKKAQVDEYVQTFGRKVIILHSMACLVSALFRLPAGAHCVLHGVLLCVANRNRPWPLLSASVAVV